MDDRLFKIILTVAGFLLACTVSVVTWIALQVWEMNPKLVSTADRVERIVDALPSVRIRLAQEELQKTFSSAVITTEPIQRDNDQWRIYVHHMDFTRGAQRTYVIPSSGPDDHTVGLKVSGYAERMIRDRRSFEELLDAASELSRPVSLHTSIDPKSSYLFTRTTSDPLIFIEKTLGKPTSQLKIDPGKVRFEDLLRQYEKTTKIVIPSELKSEKQQK